MMKEISESEFNTPNKTLYTRKSKQGIGNSRNTIGKPEKSSVHRKVLEVYNEDEEIDPSQYQDVRFELQSSGLNLTSVLINPRETIFGDLFDEFAADQSQPLEYQSPIANLSSSNSVSSLFSYSMHASPANASATLFQSNHSHSMPSSSLSGASSSLFTAPIFAITDTEIDELHHLVKRLENLYKSFSPEGSELFSGSRYDLLNRSQSSSHYNVKNVVVSPVSRLKKQAMEELRVCYREVPEIFFKADFSLKTSDLFYQILFIQDLSLSAASSGGAGPVKSLFASKRGGTQSDRDSAMSLATRLTLDQQLDRLKSMRCQDCLAHYLDLVEVALLKQIWARSPAFFRALDDIKGLQYLVTESTRQLKRCRGYLHGVKQETQESALSIPTKFRRQRNASNLFHKLQYIQQIIQGRLAIVNLLEVEDYFSALELISSVKSIYHRELEGVHCMRQIGSQLDDIDNLVGEVMCNKFVSLAIQLEDAASENMAAPSLDFQALNLPGGSKTDGLMALNLGQMPSSPGGRLGGGPGGTDSTDGAMRRRGLSDRESLRNLMKALIATERIQSALNMYKNRLVEALKLIVRTCVMEFLNNFDLPFGFDDQFDELPVGTDSGVASGDVATASTPFSQRISEMSNENFLSCLAMCYEHLLISLEKANEFHEFVTACLQEDEDAIFLPSSPSPGAGLQHPVGLPLDAPQSRSSTPSGLAPVLSAPVTAPSTPATSSSFSSAAASSTTPPLPSPAALSKDAHVDKERLIYNSRSCLAAACELAQKSISKLLHFHKDGNSKLSPDNMKLLWQLSLNFVLSLEQINGSTAYIIRQNLLSQSITFLNSFHESCKSKLVHTLDNERWTQCDVSPERQWAIDKLASGKAFLNSFHSEDSLVYPPESGHLGGPQVGAASHAGNLSSSQTTTDLSATRRREKDCKPVVVDGVEYRVVWSALMLVENIYTYLDIAFNFSPITADVIKKIVDLLALFNLRAKKLVLGAQAIQSAARLKSISAKHLAITGQSLKLIIALLPHVRAALLAFIPENHDFLLTDLDRTSHDLIDHHGQIVSKFVGIVGDFVDNSSLKLKDFDWDKFHGQSEYFDEVQKNVFALHRVLQTILPPEQIQDIFSRIFSSLNRKIPSHFDSVQPKTKAGKQRIVDEVAHLVTSFSRLKQLDASHLSLSLEETFRKKYGLPSETTSLLRAQDPTQAQSQVSSQAAQAHADEKETK